VWKKGRLGGTGGNSEELGGTQRNSGELGNVAEQYRMTGRYRPDLTFGDNVVWYVGVIARQRFSAEAIPYSRIGDRFAMLAMTSPVAGER
jgi:hypothetical protein